MPNADIPTCIAMLARMVHNKEPGLQQLFCSLVRCQADLKAAAVALQMHADRNARMARALPADQVRCPAVEGLSHAASCMHAHGAPGRAVVFTPVCRVQRQGKVFLAWCEGMLSERADRIASSWGRASFLPYPQVQMMPLSSLCCTIGAPGGRENS